MRLLSCLILLLFACQVALHAQEPTYAYIFAPNGLNLRGEPSADGAKLMTAPMGAQVEILSRAKDWDMTVDNLRGGMDRVRVDGKEGYMFSGYLCAAPLPAAEVEVETYVEAARDTGLELYHETIHRDYGGYFQSENGLVFEALNLQECFLLATQLFGIPKGLGMPPATGKAQYVAKNPAAQPAAWTDELVGEYDSKGNLVEITYSYRAEATGKLVGIKWDTELRGYRIRRVFIAD